MKAIKCYEHFIFDFDGVISDSLELAIRHFNEIRNELFPQLPAVQDKYDMAIVYAGPLKTCLNKWIGQEGTKEFFHQHSMRMNAARQLPKPFDGIINVLNGLGEGKVSIVTSSYGEAVKRILSTDGSFNEKILYKIAGRELHQSKTEKITAILRELEIANEDAVYVGDLESDILYCRDVPIDIISVGYGYHPIEHLKNYNPTYIIESVNDLHELLSELKSSN